MNRYEEDVLEKRAFSLEEIQAGEKLQNKLYPFVDGQRKKSPDFDNLIENLTDEEVNSGFLALIEYGYNMTDILSHPKLNKSTLNKAAYAMVTHDEFDDYSTWCRGINTLFRHGAANPYHVNEDPKVQMWPVMAMLPRLAVDGDILAPMPKDPKDAKVFLARMQTLIEEREKVNSGKMSTLARGSR